MSTVLSDGREILASASPSDFDTISPAALADLIVLGALRGDAEVLILHVVGDEAVLSLMSDNVLLEGVRVSGEVGCGAAARLAAMAGIDPLLDASSLEGPANVARVKVRAGADIGEVLISANASVRGIEVEVRALSGRAAPRAQRSVHLKRCPSCRRYESPQRDVCDADGTRLEDVVENPAPGGVIGAYLVHEPLGDGGMGTVFAAEHALIGRPAAIKVLHRGLAGNPLVIRRFLTEARAASRLDHPNIVRLTDFGLLRDGRPFAVMERLAGESLEVFIDRTGVLMPRVALLIAREIAIALVAAHEGGVLHNDLKPSNILLLTGSTEDEPRLKLLDFGAASLMDDVAADDGLVIGTPRYMSPERAAGDPTDARADLYALGIVIYEMLSGSPPLVGHNVDATLLLQIKQPPPPLTSPFGALPPAVIALVSRVLAKSPGERHQTARELTIDLDIAIAAVSRAGWRRWLP